MSYFNSRRYRTGPSTGAKLLIALAVFVALVLLVGGCVSYNQTSRVTVTVTDKESVAKQDRGHEYRVYTNKGTFKVGDSLFHGRFDSADLYGRLEDGKTYSCEVYGWRIPLFSSFKNMLNCQEV